MAYLTEDDYTTRFGEAEAIWLTEQADNGTGDADMIQAAIDDATNDAESFLIGRYDLTVVRAAVPPVLVGLVADLARERLHMDSPSDEVTARGDRARAALKEFANGTRRLPLEDGTAADETIASGSPVAVARDPVFTDEALYGYGSC